MSSQELNEKLLYIQLKAQFISTVITSLFVTVKMTKDRDCSIELLELLSLVLGGWKKKFFTIFKMQLLGKFLFFSLHMTYNSSFPHVG